MGNACDLKPSKDASLNSMKIGDLCLEKGFPAVVFNIVQGLGKEARESLLTHLGVDHYSFKGSIEVGVRVQQAATERSVPVTLELGGK